MKKLLLSLFIFSGLIVNAQDEPEETPPEGWNPEGKFQLLFNQSAFNKEWTGGGTSSMAANFILDYNLNYRRDNFTWDNKLLANYGITRLKDDEFSRKTSDRLEVNSIAGWQLEESNWYYSLFANFRTQLTKGYVYSEDELTGEEIRTETTHFMSPAYLQVGPGMMWKRNEDLWVNIAPATARFIFVDPDFTNIPGYIEGDYYGVDEGESMRFELGASISAYSKFEVLPNVTLENNLNLYSNYLDKPGNIDIDYLMDLAMGVNQYLTANFIFQAIYDDNTVGAFQIREVLGVGLTYNF